MRERWGKDYVSAFLGWCKLVKGKLLVARNSPYPWQSSISISFERVIWPSYFPRCNINRLSKDALRSFQAGASHRNEAYVYYSCWSVKLGYRGKRKANLVKEDIVYY